MISFLVRPCLVRRVDVGAGAWVVAHAASAMVCRALLAARSPPRLRRWRSVRPELAGMGAAPQRCGEGGFAAQPVGVVAGGGQQLAGDLGADARTGRGGRARSVVDEGAQRVSASVISAVRCWQRRARRAQRRLGGLDRVGQVGRVDGRAAQASTSGGWAGRRVRLRSGFGGGDDQAVELVDRGGAGLDRAARGRRAARGWPRPRRCGSSACRSARPDRAARAAAIGVDRVGLAFAAGGSCGRAGRPRPPRPARRPGTGPGRRRSCRCPPPRP